MGLWPVPCGVKPVYLWSKSNKVMFIVVGNSETLKMVNLLKIPRNPGPVDEKGCQRWENGHSVVERLAYEGGWFDGKFSYISQLVSALS